MKKKHGDVTGKVVGNNLKNMVSGLFSVIENKIISMLNRISFAQECDATAALLKF